METGGSLRQIRSALGTSLILQFAQDVETAVEDHIERGVEDVEYWEEDDWEDDCGQQ